jgi:hypothetical protein
MGGWTFAKGKENEQTLGEVVPAGATQIDLDGADELFHPGDLLFICEADGGETEFLGAAISATPAGLAFTLGPRKSKDSGAKLWRAETSFVLTAQEGSPQQRRVDTGVALEWSLGGTCYAIRTAEPMTTMEWMLDGLTPAREAEFLDWFDQATGGGLESFTIVGPDRRILAVRLNEGRYSRIGREGGRRGLRLPLLVVSEGEYR